MEKLPVSPRITVVMPAYNATQFIEESIRSVQNQSFQDWELIVVDDGSTDSTYELVYAIAAQDVRIKIVKRTNGGLSAARNSGIAVSSDVAEYLTLLDADDLWETDALEVLADYLDQHRDALAVHGLGRYIDGQGNEIMYGVGEAWVHDRRKACFPFSRRCTRTEPTTFEVLAYRDCLFVGSILLRKSVLKTVGNFDESYRMSEDHELWLRLTLHGWIGVVDHIVMLYRKHGETLSSNTKTMRRNSFRIYRSFLRRPGLSFKQRYAIWYGYQRSRNFNLDAMSDAGQNCVDGRLRLTVHFIKNRDFGSASRHLWQAIKCLISGRFKTDDPYV